LTPKSGHCLPTVGCPLCANSGHSAGSVDHQVGADVSCKSQVGLSTLEFG
jgi:hypothetical protein